MSVTTDELLSYINDLNLRVNNISNSLVTIVQTLTGSITTTNEKFDTIDANINSYTYNFSYADELIHNEIHDVRQGLSSQIENYDSYFTYVNSHLVNLELSYTNLSYNYQNTYSYLTEEDFNLHNEIHDVRQDLFAQVENYDSYFTYVDSHLVNLELAYNTLSYNYQNTYSYLLESDFNLHNEIHDVRQDLFAQVENYDSYFTNIGRDINNLQSSYNTLSYIVSINKEDMDEATYELHNEIHDVRQGLLTYFTTVCDNLSYRVTQLENS